MDMPKYSTAKSRETSRAENTHCYAADFPPAAILVGGESIVRFSTSVVGNDELTHVILSYTSMDYRVLESETNTTHGEIARYSFVFDLPKL